MTEAVGSAPARTGLSWKLWAVVFVVMLVPMAMSEMVALRHGNVDWIAMLSPAAVLVLAIGSYQREKGNAQMANGMYVVALLLALLNIATLFRR